MYQIRNSGWIEVITGSMFSGKTTELVHRLEKVEIANQEYKVFKPIVDDRYAERYIVTHSGIRWEAIPLDKSEDILDQTYEELDVVAIDEIQFWDDDIIDVIESLVDKNIRVIACGLDTDFRGEPFGSMSTILAKSEYVTKLKGVCQIEGCGELGTKTQRYVNGEPAHINDPLVVIGGKESYKCVCRHHHTVKTD